jgi:hypothetical protein
MRRQCFRFRETGRKSTEPGVAAKTSGSLFPEISAASADGFQGELVRFLPLILPKSAIMHYTEIREGLTYFHMGQKRWHSSRLQIL